MQLVTPESVCLSSTRLERIKPVMQQYIDKGTFAGIVTFISRYGQPAHLEAFGVQDLESGRPMAADTIFCIFSMSKPITSAAVMMLCEEGRLRLSDPLSRYLPEFKEARVMVSRGGADYDLVPARRKMRTAEVKCVYDSHGTVALPRTPSRIRSSGSRPSRRVEPGSHQERGPATASRTVLPT